MSPIFLLMCGDVAGINYYLESKENWSRNDWATVSREAKARRGKSMKTCTRIGRVTAQLVQLGNEQKELIHGAR